MRRWARSNKNSGALVSPVRLKASGEVRGIMLFVDFPDANATSTTQSLYDELVASSQEWFRTTSYGRMTLSVKPVHQWLRMPRSSSSYGVTRANLSFANQRQLMADAIAAANASVDFRGYQLIYRSDRATQAAFESAGITFSLLAEDASAFRVRVTCSAQVCRQPPAVKPKPARCRVSLAITKDFVATGRVRSALARCARTAAVAIQLRRGKSWRGVRATRAKADGTFRVRLSRRAGVYRAFVRARSGCGPASSQPRRPSPSCWDGRVAKWGIVV